MRFSQKLSKHQPTYIRLRGGLGNQLFGYFAGEYLRASLDHDVRYIPSSQAYGVFGQASSISDLGIHIQDPSKQPKTRTATLKRKLYTLGVELGVSKSLLSSKLRLFRSEEVGFDSKLDSIVPGTLVEGYFQSYKYIDYVIEKVGTPVIAIEKPTAWLAHQLNRAREEKPIMVHVRRGDYRSLAATYGNLDSKYYLEGVDAICAVLGQRPVWVFSDDPDQVQLELGGELPKSAVFISQPRDSSAAEAMMLMAQSSALVISNSTFSWWAAKLGDRKRVIAPNPWFVAQNEPTDLIPPSWERIDSVWARGLT